jgi:hypothetical protein
LAVRVASRRRRAASTVRATSTTVGILYFGLGDVVDEFYVLSIQFSFCISCVRIQQSGTPAAAAASAVRVASTAEGGVDGEGDVDDGGGGIDGG